MKKNSRLQTEQRLLDAVGLAIAENGFEKIGINALSARAGVPKMLIYRYFGSLTGLIQAYIKQNDFWVIQSSKTIPNKENLPNFFKELFREYVAALHANVVLRRLYRWELTENNDLTKHTFDVIEQQSVEMLKYVAKVSEKPYKEVVVLGTILNTALTYLVLHAEARPSYNGIALNKKEGWKDIMDGIDLCIDLWFNQK